MFGTLRSAAFSLPQPCFGFLCGRNRSRRQNAANSISSRPCALVAPGDDGHGTVTLRQVNHDQHPGPRGAPGAAEPAPRSASYARLGGTSPSPGAVCPPFPAASSSSEWATSALAGEPASVLGSGRVPAVSGGQEVRHQWCHVAPGSARSPAAVLGGCQVARRADVVPVILKRGYIKHPAD